MVKNNKKRSAKKFSSNVKTTIGASFAEIKLDNFNEDEDIDIVRLDSHKIDGSLLCLSSNLPSPFIAPDMHFVREDTCASIFFQIHGVPQYHVTNRLKGHNYWHPKKRTNTDATRNDKVFKQYAERSQESMNIFLRGLQ